MVLVRYGSDDNRLKVWEKVDWMIAIRIASIFIRDFYLQYTKILILSDKEPVIVSPVVTVHTLRKKWEVKIVSDWIG